MKNSVKLLEKSNKKINEVYRRLNDPNLFLSGINAKTSLQDDLNSATNLNFEGSESIASGELANLRKHCFNFVVLKFYIKNKNRSDSPVHSILNKLSILTPQTQSALQKIWQDEDNSNAVKLAKQIKLKMRQTIKILLTYFMPIAYLKHYLLNSLLLIAKDYPLSFIYSMIFETIFQTMLLDFNQTTVLLNYISIILESRNNVHLLENDNKDRLSESNLIYFKNQVKNASDDKDDESLMIKAIEFDIKFRNKENSTEESKNLLNYFLPSIGRLVCERIIQVSFFLRKHMLYLVLNIENEIQLDSIIKQMLTNDLQFVRTLPLKAFVSISKTFFVFFNHKIENLKFNSGQTTLKDDWLGNFLELYLLFCIDFFSSDFHYFLKKETEYSVNDFESYNKIVVDLHSIFLSINRFLDAIFKSNSGFLNMSKYNFFNRFKGSLSGISKNLNHSNKSFFTSNLKTPKDGKVNFRLCIRIVLSFLKNKIDSLRAKMFYSYKNLEMNPIYNQFKLTDADVTQCVEHLLNINPITSVLFSKLFSK